MQNRIKSKQSQKSFERCAFLWICSSPFSWTFNSYSYLDMNYILHTLDKAATVFVQTIYSDIVDNYLWFMKYMSYNTCTQSEPSLFSSGHRTVLFSHTHTIWTLKHAKTHNKHTWTQNTHTWGSELKLWTCLVLILFIPLIVSDSPNNCVSSLAAGNSWNVCENSCVGQAHALYSLYGSCYNHSYCARPDTLWLPGYRLRTDCFMSPNINIGFLTHWS